MVNILCPGTGKWVLVNMASICFAVVVHAHKDKLKAWLYSNRLKYVVGDDSLHSVEQDDSLRWWPMWDVVYWTMT